MVWSAHLASATLDAAVLTWEEFQLQLLARGYTWMRPLPGLLRGVFKDVIYIVVVPYSF